MNHNIGLETHSVFAVVAGALVVDLGVYILTVTKYNAKGRARIHSARLFSTPPVRQHSPGCLNNGGPELKQLISKYATTHGIEAIAVFSEDEMKLTEFTRSASQAGVPCHVVTLHRAAQYISIMHRMNKQEDLGLGPDQVMAAAAAASLVDEMLKDVAYRAEMYPEDQELQSRVAAINHTTP